LADTHALGINILFFTPAGKLYAGVAATNKTTQTPNQVGLVSYDSSTAAWSAVAGAPLNITALLQDSGGNLIAGTGTTGNFSPYPINYGSGIYLYNGAAWVAVNSGIPTVSTLSGPAVLPYIKQLQRDSKGNILAATYGRGVLLYNSATSSWSTYGIGLANLNVNVMAINKTGMLYAGLDDGVAYTDGNEWIATSNGLPNKPVRALTVDGSGKLYAGLGFYHWMDGSLAGEIFASADNGSSWQSSSAGYVASDVLSMVIDSKDNVFVGTAGVWKSSDMGAAWVQVRTANVGAAQIFDIAKNSKGDLFAIGDNLPQYFGYGGVFRSLDNGVTWTQIIKGIDRHRGNFIFCDSKDNLWAGFTTMVGTASNGSNTNGALYKSTDNGDTWIQNDTILVPSLKFTQMMESQSGKLYVTNGFGGPSNISSSFDYATWNNSLNTAGGMVFNEAVNSAGDVFIGTETQGIMRSSNDGTGTFTSTITPMGGGNSLVYVDPYSDFVFGSVPGGADGVYVFGSLPSDSGSNMFEFAKFPIYASIGAMTFDNRGNLYAVARSGNFANSGLYTSPSPWSASSVFTKVMANANVSYYFSSMLVDKCGYIYGSQPGAGVYRSGAAVNTPSTPLLQIPPNGTVGSSPAVSFAWTDACSLDGFRIQIATDAGFLNIVHDVTPITAMNYTVNGSVLSSNTTYYWRVSAVNAVGSSWTLPFSFTTSALPDIIFFNGFGVSGIGG